MCDHVIRFIKRLMSGAQMLACSSRGQLRAVYGEGVCNMKQRQILGLCVSVKSLTWLLLYSGTEKKQSRSLIVIQTACSHVSVVHLTSGDLVGQHASVMISSNAFFNRVSYMCTM